MPLQDTVIPIDYGQGLDTKTDPKLVVPGKMLRLENAVFTKSKSLVKRNGYVALSTVLSNSGTMVAPKLAHAYGDELLTVDRGVVYSLSPSNASWIDKGQYVPTQLERTSVDQDHPGSGAVDSAILGNYALYGWSTATQGNPGYPIVYGEVYGSVVDLSTGAIVSRPSTAAAAVPVLLSTSTTSTMINYPRCVLLGGTVLAIAYIAPGNNDIKMRTVTFPTIGNVYFGAETSIGTGYSAGPFDIVETPTGASILYVSGAGATVTIANINTSGVVTASTTIATATSTSAVKLVRNTFDGNLWAYWNENGNLDIVYAVVSSALASVLVKTLAVSNAGLEVILNIIAVVDSAIQVTIYWGQRDGTYLLEAVYTMSTTVTGGGSLPALWCYGVTPFSNPVTVGTDRYAVFVSRGVSPGFPQVTYQPTFFLVRITNVPATGIPLVVARFAAAVANTQITSAANGGPAGSIYYTPMLHALTASKLLFPCGVQTQEYRSDFFSSISYSPAGVAGAYSYTFDLNGAEIYVATNSAQMAVLNGGLVSAYDGNHVSELGFHVFPELAQLASQNIVGSGLVAGSTYSYIAIFQWTDAQGNLHQSAPSIAQGIAPSPGDNSIRITVTVPYMSQKTGMSVAIYRTQALGSVYYLVTNPAFLLEVDPLTQQTVSYDDILSDAQIAGSPVAYTYPGSAVLENSVLPPAQAITAHNNRLWLVDAENKNQIWYGKSFQQAVGLSMSQFLVNQIDPKNGGIVALSQMDEKLIILKETGVMYQSGDGANDTGAGSTLSFPQIIPSDVGCSELKSVVVMPGGVMFKSPNGIYIVSRSTQIMYLGMEVEAYNSQTITNAVLVPGRSQIRFLCASGLTLVYDYIFNQWSTFTAHTGHSATAWQGTYVYASTGGKMLQESQSVYRDDGVSYAVLAQTSWLALASVQGFQRVRRLIMLGDYANGAGATHGIQVQAAYDFNPSLSAPIAYTFGAAASSGSFQYRERLPIQKCDSISLTIQEVTAADAADYIDLTNISFEAGAKKGANKLPATRSVG